MSYPQSVKVRVQGDISAWESESLYSLLSDVYQVDIECDPELPEEVVTRLGLIFPSPFEEAFFESFGRESWRHLMGLLKEFKRRRGSKGAGYTISFQGYPTLLSFGTESKRNETVNSALDKVEYLTDIVRFQTDPRIIPVLMKEVSYRYTDLDRKWKVAYSISVGGAERYVFDEQETRWVRT